MYYLYVDESGDPGLMNSPTSHFILAGLVVHELRWNECLQMLIAFRKRMKQRYGLPVSEEIHASPWLNKPGAIMAQISKNDRLMILRNLLDELAHMPDLSVFAVDINKHGKTAGYDVFEKGWTYFIQRFGTYVFSLTATVIRFALSLKIIVSGSLHSNNSNDNADSRARNRRIHENINN